MTCFKRIIEMAKKERGKFFVLDEAGEPQLVIMSFEEYEKERQDSDLSQLSERLEVLSQQTEELNRQISQVQLEEGVGEEIDLPTEGAGQSENYYVEPLADGEDL